MQALVNAFWVLMRQDDPSTKMIRWWNDRLFKSQVDGKIGL